MLILKVRRRLDLNKVVVYHFLEIVIVRLIISIEAIIDFRGPFLIFKRITNISLLI